jgi:hypothetical protein
MNDYYKIRPLAWKKRGGAWEAGTILGDLTVRRPENEVIGGVVYHNDGWIGEALSGDTVHAYAVHKTLKEAKRVVEKWYVETLEQALRGLSLAQLVAEETAAGRLEDGTEAHE